MNKKRFFIALLALVAILALSLFALLHYESNKSKQNEEQGLLSKESIIVKRAIIVQRIPGQTYFTPYVKTYEDTIVKKGEEFSIEGFECDGCSGVLDLKLKLVDIKNNSVVIETQYPYWTNETKEIKSGDQVDAWPGIVDARSFFEFKIGKKADQLLLEYKWLGYSTMPGPNLFLMLLFQKQLTIALILLLVGLILGFIGLKSKYKKISIAGIVLCSITLIIYFVLYLFML